MLAAATVALAGCATAPAQPTGKDIVWETPRSGPSTTGTGLPPAPVAQEAAAPAGQPDGCREYSHTVTIDGRETQAYGRACPQPDGSWRMEAPATLPRISGPAAPMPVYPVQRYPVYYPPMFYGSAFYFSGHRHRHHHHGHRHRRFR